MTRIMRDSVNVASIPLAGTQIAAGYDDGNWKTITALLARFPHLPIVHIDVNGSTPSAHVRDWETGDKAGNLRDWVVEHNKLSGRKDAVVYCNRATIPEVRNLTGDQILNKDYFLWIATLDGTLYTPSMLPGVIACQDKGAAQVHANYDESVVWADWWPNGAANPATPVSQPGNNSKLWPAGVTLQQGSKGDAVYALQYALRDCGLRLSAELGNPDGDFGPRTKIALEAYQRDESLSPDGIAGPKTRASMVAHGFLTRAGEGT